MKFETGVGVVLTCNMYVGVPLTFLCSRSFWSHLGAIVSKWPVTEKRRPVERNGVKIGTGRGGVPVTCIWDIFDLLVFKVILGSFGALISKWPITKTTGRRAKRNEMWASGVLVTCIWGYF